MAHRRKRFAETTQNPIVAGRRVLEATGVGSKSTFCDSTGEASGNVRLHCGRTASTDLGRSLRFPERCRGGWAVADLKVESPGCSEPPVPRKNILTAQGSNW